MGGNAVREEAGLVLQDLHVGGDLRVAEVHARRTRKQRGTQGALHLPRAHGDPGAVAHSARPDGEAATSHAIAVEILSGAHDLLELRA